MGKKALFAFNGELMCFVHVLLNALDMDAKGENVKIVFEGASTALIPQLAQKQNPFHQLYAESREKGLVAGACKACSAKMQVLDDVIAQDISLLDNMNGHPSISEFQDKGYMILTF